MDKPIVSCRLYNFSTGGYISVEVFDDYYMFDATRICIGCADSLDIVLLADTISFTGIAYGVDCVLSQYDFNTDVSIESVKRLVKKMKKKYLVVPLTAAIEEAVELGFLVRGRDV